MSLTESIGMLGTYSNPFPTGQEKKVAAGVRRQGGKGYKFSMICFLTKHKFSLRIISK